MTWVFATNNPGKAKELTAMLPESVSLLSLSDLGLVFVPEETGDTFEENATIKARETAVFLAKHGHYPEVVIADDSGIEIDAMDKKPGVDSANFLGADTPYDVRNAKILEMLAEEKNRTARFVCVIACATPYGFDGYSIRTVRATIEGEIARAAAGENGFGYDPIFMLPQRNLTTAQLSPAEKNAISHRGKAFKQMMEVLGVLPQRDTP